jgi:hypothetical protein
MADDKIDPAVVQLARENPYTVYLQGGHAIVYTSTCKDTNMPACWPVRSENRYTPQLYTAIRARFASVADSTLSYKQRLYYAGQPYGRSESTVKTALRKTGYSAIAEST